MPPRQHTRVARDGADILWISGRVAAPPATTTNFDAAINQGKDEGNAARLFVLNADGTISPQRASNLVFGIRGLL